VVDAVGEHHRPEPAAEQEQGKVDGVGVTHPTADNTLQP
jgi:hypothetical protein